MVQVRLIGDTPTIDGALGRDGLGRSRSARPCPSSSIRIPPISQAVASRAGGTLLGVKKPAKKKQHGPKPIPPAKLQGRHGQRLRRAGRRDAGQDRAAAAPAGRTPTSPARSRRRTCSRPPSTTRTPRARLSAERLRRSLGDTDAPRLLPAAMSDFGLGADVVVAIGSAFSGVTAPPEQAAKQQRPAARAPARAGRGPERRGRLLPAPEEARLPAPVSVERAARIDLRRGDRDDRQRVPHVPAGQARQVRWPSTRARRSTRRMPGACATRPGRTRRSSISRAGRSAGTRSGRCASTRTAAAIHRIAVFYGGQPCKASGGVVVWIDNSLDDKLSPETMIAIARSLVPAHKAPA